MAYKLLTKLQRRNILRIMNTLPTPPQQYLHDLRVNANLSDEKIGKAIGVHRSTVFRLRTGRHSGTDYSIGERIADLHTRVIKAKK